MKSTTALKQALNDPEFQKAYDAFKRCVENYKISGSLQFYIGDEAFYYGGEAQYSDIDQTWGFYYACGKHTPGRAQTLISRGDSYEIKLA